MAPTPPATTGSSKMVACPACGASITLRAIGQSVMVACPSCGSQIDVSRPDIRLIQKYNQQVGQLHVPLGTRGKLRGQLFEVIGAMQRSSSDGRWEEYLLFNPFQGFRWLTLDGGHWSLGQMIKDTAALRPDIGRPYQGHVFRKYDMDRVTVDWVVGEFYWRVRTGDQVVATDYIAPPWMLSCEKSADETTWTILEYLQPAEVEAAFKIQCPERTYLGINQPNDALSALSSVRRTALYALLAAFVLQLMGMMIRHSGPMEVGSYELNHGADDETRVYGPFTLTAGHTAAAVLARAPLDNAWVELQGGLVSTSSGQNYRFVDSFQYYHGRDSDGDWSEGATEGRAVISSVPAGTYNLVVDGSSGDQNGRPVEASVQLALQLNTVTWRNFWIAVILILAYPVYLLVRCAAYERERWSGSDFRTRS